jgi:hypothetical protein
MHQLGPVSPLTSLGLCRLPSLILTGCLGSGSALVELSRLLEPRRIRRWKRYGRGQGVGAGHALCRSGGCDRYHP